MLLEEQFRWSLSGGACLVGLTLPTEGGGLLQMFLAHDAFSVVHLNKSKHPSDFFSCSVWLMWLWSAGLGGISIFLRFLQICSPTISGDGTVFLTLEQE